MRSSAAYRSKGRDPRVGHRREAGGGEDGSPTHFEAFQMSEVCVKLFKDRVLETKVKDSDDPACPRCARRSLLSWM
ncbi:hypothetical protein ZWY2020_057366 [Hordeum vulgare]|nr:hypothetical protein ZWY2020_057366 [Hordeum vulgare]